MTTFSEVVKAISAAAIVVWAVWTELRLRQTQSTLAEVNLELSDKIIESNVEKLSDIDLTAKLNKDLGPSGNPPKS